MTYEDRQRYRDLQERMAGLRERLEEGDADRAMTADEALELLEVVEASIERMSPERWDRALEVVAQEAARRAGSLPG